MFQQVYKDELFIAAQGQLKIVNGELPEPTEESSLPSKKVCPPTHSCIQLYDACMCHKCVDRCKMTNRADRLTDRMLAGDLVV